MIWNMMNLNRNNEIRIEKEKSPNQLTWGDGSHEPQAMGRMADDTHCGHWGCWGLWGWPRARQWQRVSQGPAGPGILARGWSRCAPVGEHRWLWWQWGSATHGASCGSACRVGGGGTA